MTTSEAAVQTRQIALLSLAAFASTSAFRVCDPMLPELATAFATTTGNAASTITFFSIAYGVMQLVYGPLGDLYGKYRVVAFATIGCALASLGCALAPSLEWLFAARVLAGATGAGIVPMSMAWIGDNVPYAQRQTTIARFLVGSITGMSAGSLLGGVFTDTVGWRGAFAALAAIFFLVGTLIYRELRRQGTVAAGAPAPGPPPVRPRWWAQTRQLLQAPWARVVLITAFVEGMVLFGALSFVPLYLFTRYGVSLLAAGVIAAVFGIGGLAYVTLAPRLLRRLGEAGLATAGGAVLCVTFLALRFAPTILWTLPAIFGIGLGFFMLHNTLQTNATQMLPAARGTAVATFASALFIGQSVGVALASLVVDTVGVSWLLVVAGTALPLIASGFVWRLRGRGASA